MDKLCAAMAKAFPDIEGATKDSSNPHFKSKYADLSSVVNAIKPALCKNGLFYTQKTHDREGGVCVETVLFHASGESMSFGTLFVPASKNDAQGYGSALTYARRYSLMSAFGVSPEDDDGNAASLNIVNAPLATRPPEPKPREKLSGPHMTVAVLKEAAAAIREEVLASADHDTLDAYLIAERETIAQIKRDRPDWWTHPDYGLDGVIGAAYLRIENEIKESAE